MSLLLFLDADSLPIKHREIIIKRCIKENIESYFVADRQLKDVLDSIKEHTVILRKPYRGVLSNEEKSQAIKELIQRFFDSKCNYNNFLEYCIDQYHVSTEKNICAISVECAKLNKMSLAEFWNLTV